MKTILPESIQTIDQAKTFLEALHLNGELFHPEDDPAEIFWACQEPTNQEIAKLACLMQQVQSMSNFDPFQFIQTLQ